MPAFQSFFLDENQMLLGGSPSRPPRPFQAYSPPLNYLEDIVVFGHAWTFTRAD